MWPPFVYDIAGILVAVSGSHFRRVCVREEYTHCPPGSPIPGSPSPVSPITIDPIIRILGTRVSILPSGLGTGSVRVIIVGEERIGETGTITGTTFIRATSVFGGVFSKTKQFSKQIISHVNIPDVVLHLIIGSDALMYRSDLLCCILLIARLRPKTSKTCINCICVC